MSSSASVRGARLGHRDAEAGADDDVVVIELERAGQCLEDPLGGLGGGLDVVHVLQQDRELVAAEARGGVGGTDARRDPLGHLEQHPVTGGVAEAVVDGLEVVEVDEHDGHPDPFAQRPRHRVADALVEQRAVGQVGDGVVEGLVGELLLELLALGDVAAVEDDAADGLVVEQVGVQDLEVTQLAVLGLQQALDDLGTAGGAGAVGQAAQHPALLLGVQQRLERAADDLVGGVAEDPLDRRALVGDRVVGAQDGDEVGGVGDQRGEARLAGLAVDLLRQLGAAQRQRHLVGQGAHRVAGVGVAARSAGHDEHQQRAGVVALAQLQPEDGFVADRQAQLLARVGRQHGHTARVGFLDERRDLAGDRPVGQAAAIVDGQHADALAGDAAQARVHLVAAELDDRLQRGDDDLVAVGGADEQAARRREGAARARPPSRAGAPARPCGR